MNISGNAQRFLELRSKYNSFEIGGDPAYVMVNRYNIDLSDDGQHLVMDERPTREDEQFLRDHKAEYIEYLRLSDEYRACYMDITDEELAEVEAYDEAHKPAPVVSSDLTMAQMLGFEED